MTKFSFGDGGQHLEIPLFLVRWGVEAEIDCIRDEGVGNWSLYDLVHCSRVFVCGSVADAKRLVEDQLIDGDLVLSDGDADEQGVSHVTNADFSWDDEHAETDHQYAVEFRGDDIVALVFITPLVVEQPTGGPE